MEYLYNKLLNYRQEDIYPMHMPGHKRNTELINMVDPYAIDITEIDGFDNLHDAKDILFENMQDAARLYGALHTHYLINGSTSGLLVAVAACTSKGDTILMARNCHKAVYNAVYLNELVPVYLYPSSIEKYGIQAGITAEQVKEQLIIHPEVKAVVITSPTYEGMVSEIEEIVKVAHSYRIPVIVDEAHGAHFGYSEAFPESSVRLGADIVIHSVHKTLPAFTQTALIHINGPYVDYDKVKRYLGIYQTSSPSYVLMSGISNCIRLLKEKKDELFSVYEQNLIDFYRSIRSLKHIVVYQPEQRVEGSDGRDNHKVAFDLSKIVIFTKFSSLSSVELYNRLLYEYKIQCEMVERDYVLAMTSIADTKSGLDRLRDALLEIDNKITVGRDQYHGLTYMIGNLTLALTPYQAYNHKKECINFKHCIGKIAGDYIYLYPPGIPILVPGEQITKQVIDILCDYKRAGLVVKGLVNDIDMTIVAVGEE